METWWAQWVGEVLRYENVCVFVFLDTELLGFSYRCESSSVCASVWKVWHGERETHERVFMR